MTQELLASILGVRRESITGAASRLQDAGYIRYRRGHILVTDRAGLEGESCECYGALRREIGGPVATHPSDVLAPQAGCGAAETELNAV
jgi:hypothetical protein